MAELSKEQRQIEQAKTAELLQDAWLSQMLQKVQAGTISDTGMATLERFFARNGWVVDPARFAKSAAELLTTGVKPEDFERGDPDVVGAIKSA